MNLKETLAELHNLLAKTMLEKIQTGELTAADLNVIRQFLKDNGIDAAAIPAAPIRRLADALPFVDDRSVDVV